MRPKHLKPRFKAPLTRAAAALTLTCMLSTAALPALAEGTQPEAANLPVSQTAADSAQDAEIALQASNSLTTNPIVAEDGAEVAHDGDVSTSDSTGVSVKNGGNVTITGDVKTAPGQGVIIHDGGTVRIDGSVNATTSIITGAGVKVIGDKASTVTVGKDIICNGDIGAEVSNCNLTVGGNVQGNMMGISTSSGSNVKVGGDVTSKGIYGIFAESGSHVTVDGNVTGKGNGLWVSSDSLAAIVTVKGTVTGETGAVAKGGATIIAGSVKSTGSTAIKVAGDDNGIQVINDVSTESDSLVFDLSEVKGIENEIAIAGKVVNGSVDTTLKVNTNTDGTLNDHSQLEFVVGEIEDFSKVKVADKNGAALSKENQQKVLDDIKYIVRHAEKSEDGQAAITVTRNDGSALAKDKLAIHDVAKKGEEIIVKVETIPGWVAKILPGKDNTVRKNDDGSFTVTVVEGGGIDIRAVLEKIDTPTDPSDDTNGGSSASSAWLYVVGKDGNRVPYTQEQKGGVMVFTTAEETAALTGNLKALEELGVNTVQFVTPNKTSAFTVSTVCSAGGEDDVFVLAHDTSGATLFAGNAVHNEYLS